MRHHDVYYPVRMDLVQHMINSMQRLGFTQSATIEHRKLAVDLAEVICEWEKRRYKEEETTETPNNVVGMKRPGDSTDVAAVKRARGNNSPVRQGLKLQRKATHMEIHLSIVSGLNLMLKYISSTVSFLYYFEPSKNSNERLNVYV